MQNVAVGHDTDKASPFESVSFWGAAHVVPFQATASIVWVSESLSDASNAKIMQNVGVAQERLPRFDPLRLLGSARVGPDQDEPFHV